MKIVYERAIAPHNYKKGELVMGRYRPIDILIMVIAFGIFVAVLLSSMFIFEFEPLFFIIVGIIIPVVLVALVQPLNNYHNYLEYIRLVILWKLRDKSFSNLIVDTKSKEKQKKTKIKRKSRK